MNYENVPIIKSEITKYGGRTFLCEKCSVYFKKDGTTLLKRPKLTYHIHGSGLGHRVAHCLNKNNYPKGYILSEHV